MERDNMNRYASDCVKFMERRYSAFLVRYIKKAYFVP